MDVALGAAWRISLRRQYPCRPSRTFWTYPMHTGEGSSSPPARLIIVRRRRQSQHEAGCDTDGQQQRGRASSWAWIPQLEDLPPWRANRRGPPRGILWQRPLYVSRASRGPRSDLWLFAWTTWADCAV